MNDDLERIVWQCSVVSGTAHEHEECMRVVRQAETAGELQRDEFRRMAESNPRLIEALIAGLPGRRRHTRQSLFAALPIPWTDAEIALLTQHDAVKRDYVRAPYDDDAPPPRGSPQERHQALTMLFIYATAVIFVAGVLGVTIWG